jgi:uncharacterized repeat protein (TIGR02543 family)
MAIVWGSEYGGHNKGRLGFDVSQIGTDSEVTVNVKVYVWSRYAVNDPNNQFYYDCGTNITAATTEIGTVNVNAQSNTAWSESNINLIGEATHTISKQNSAVTYNVYASLSGVEQYGAQVYANTSFTVPALGIYTVTYDANGGSGAPEVQTFIFNSEAPISTQIPTRTGYTFVNWKASHGEYYFDPGDSIPLGWGNLTLIAQWKAQGILHINKNGTYVKGQTWVKHNGSWKKGIPWIKVNGTWKKGGA